MKKKKRSVDEILAILEEDEKDDTAVEAVEKMSDEEVARDVAAAGVDVEKLKARILAARPAPPSGGIGWMGPAALVAAVAAAAIAYALLRRSPPPPAPPDAGVVAPAPRASEPRLDDLVAVPSSSGPADYKAASPPDGGAP